ncbi:DegT/DnrJ/EryC1/StrS family aminotransferase [Actinosynnema pretiosum subsp. pretiosum]|uniref:DegT/DnrJ/EryC1/StrS aminotransferase n=2 Tax=Actinosynnema TaxID=40566 RepID=C6WCR5_ACTMD|nr:DegT/DnrJ/EryC1/StrS family aminotransferase [Actinosynnema mirum]ACU35682.1 DegT/DnrJ/EryC1/StrS aminotransferase [Actinosynnema mirum DSM 43827]AXX29109.1 DegT/DnrJ/EryC1/StrS aminotransferase [Actinosynnema pretiosum subsp. pretiosum]QUF06616.1 DegT/DnrJ/EryC1/StrS family aminotransferase [Actinosynnema pretiosum subsp. pretiosum]
MIPITRLHVGQEEADAAAEAVRSGWLSVGPRAGKFEQQVAEQVGAKHAVSVNSATTGLHLALAALGIGEGDEVICPSFTFIATPNSIRYTGATPVFADIDERTYNIDPAHVEQLITPRTRAIMPASQIGLPADLKALRAIADKHGLFLVEDAAPAYGATIDGVRLGAISDLTVFSFDARKILTTGEGGVVTTDNDEWAARLRALRAHAASVSTLARHTSTAVIAESYDEVGFNYKMTDIQAAVGVVQLGKLDHVVKTRRSLAARYDELLKGNDAVVTPFEPEGYGHVYQSYLVRLVRHERMAVMTAMAERGVATRRITACHLEPVYHAGEHNPVLPVTEKVAADHVLLPHFVGLTDEEQDEVVAALSAATA